MGIFSGCKGSSFCSPCHKNQRVAITVYTFRDLQLSTSSFSQENLIGKGSHACVYKGTLQNSQIVAVKRPTRGRRKLRDVSTFDNEIEILSKLNSKYLVNLIGYCSEGTEKLLVLEYMVNGTLHDILHRASEPLSLPMRVHIALQAAQGILALHSASPPVIHRDIKSSNILIDSKWNAKLGDLGLAIRGHLEDVVRGGTPPAGTIGYIDPEYETPDRLSTGADVFSFGILLFEIISGRNAIDVRYSPSSLLDWAIPLVKCGKALSLFDKHLISLPSEEKVVVDLTSIAARCVRHSSERRPSMSEVVTQLKEIRKRIPLSPLALGSMKNTVIIDSRLPTSPSEVTTSPSEQGTCSDVGTPSMSFSTAKSSPIDSDGQSVEPLAYRKLESQSQLKQRSKNHRHLADRKTDVFEGDFPEVEPQPARQSYVARRSTQVPATRRASNGKGRSASRSQASRFELAEAGQDNSKSTKIDPASKDIRELHSFLSSEMSILVSQQANQSSDVGAGEATLQPIALSEVGATVEILAPAEDGVPVRESEANKRSSLPLLIHSHSKTESPDETPLPQSESTSNNSHNLLSLRNEQLVGHNIATDDMCSSSSQQQQGNGTHSETLIEEVRFPTRTSSFRETNGETSMATVKMLSPFTNSEFPL